MPRNTINFGRPRLEKNGIKFSWKIENLNCVKDMILASPKFSSDYVMWEVGIKKSSSEEGEHFEFGLKSFECNQYSRLDGPLETYSCLLTFHDCDASLIFRGKKTFTINRRVAKKISFGNVIKKCEVRNSTQPVISHNILTVHCLIWISSHDILHPPQFFTQTQINPPNEGISEKAFIWKIENAKSFTVPQTRVEPFGDNGDYLIIKLSLRNNNNFQVSFTAIITTSVRIKFKMSVLDNAKKKTQYLNKECLFKETGQEFEFNTYIKQSELTRYPNWFSPQDTMSLHFDCKISIIVTFHGAVSENEFLGHSCQHGRIPEPGTSSNHSGSIQPSSELGHSHSLPTDLRDMITENFLSDCILRAGSEDFHVHKAILGARSRIFKDIFATNTEENDPTLVVIQDVDKDTVRRLLRFIYTDTVEEMEWESASRLYSAANKYDLENLKRTCSEILRSGLCVSSILQVLKLADIHQDEVLISSAMDFISRHDSEIIGSQNWLRFEEENATLAAKVLRILCLRTINRR